MVLEPAAKPLCMRRFSLLQVTISEPIDASQQVLAEQLQQDRDALMQELLSAKSVAAEHERRASASSLAAEAAANQADLLRRSVAVEHAWLWTQAVLLLQIRGACMLVKPGRPGDAAPYCCVPPLCMLLCGP